MSDQDIRGDYRPKMLIQNKLENNFYENLPNEDYGSANTNKIAGMNPNRFNQSLGINPLQVDKKDFQIKKDNFEEVINNTRRTTEKVKADSAKVWVELY